MRSKYIKFHTSRFIINLGELAADNNALMMRRTKMMMMVKMPRMMVMIMQFDAADRMSFTWLICNA